MRKQGFVVHACNIHELAGIEQYDMISMCDVLEHMPFPTCGLIAAQRLLKPNGYLFVSLPNSDSPLWRAMDNANVNPYWIEIEHYHNFSRRRLYALLDEYGFCPERCWVSNRYKACIDVLATRL